MVADVRGTRAFRNPEPRETLPFRAGEPLITTISDALGAAVADATLESISNSTPSLPTDVVDGPNMLTLGKFAAYDLT